MEPRFGHDFSSVRVHIDASAARSARAVNALAYTIGRDVVFGERQYAPYVSAGQRLVAHELTHVVQQAGSSVSNAQRLSQPDEAGQRKAVATRLAGARSGALSLQRQATGAVAPSDGKAGCTVGAGISNSTCGAYASNSWWLPFAYVNNATCACTETPNVPTAMCVRKFLQDRLVGTPGWLKTLAGTQKAFEPSPGYQAFVQTILTPRIYEDHVDAYASCCCPSGPAPYPAWMGVTTIPLPCVGVGAAIRQFGSCHGIPGAW